jgi:hypothetical protein
LVQHDQADQNALAAQKRQLMQTGQQDALPCFIPTLCLQGCRYMLCKLVSWYRIFCTDKMKGIQT